MTVESGDFRLPAISKEAADKLLADVGLTPNGKFLKDPSPDDDGLMIRLYDRAIQMAYEAARAVRGTNPELLQRIQRAVHLNYRDSEEPYRRIYTIGSMAVVRACSHELGLPFVSYLDGMSKPDLDMFEMYLACATPLTTKSDILDEVLNGPQIPPHHQSELVRALGFMSMFSVDSDLADKFRTGSACTYLAIDATWHLTPDLNDRSKRSIPLGGSGVVKMERVPVPGNDHHRH